MPVEISADSLLQGVEDMAERMADRLGTLFVEEVQSNASRRTGELADSVTLHPPVISDEEISMTVTVDAQSDSGDFYGQYQDEGTGIYGPEGVPITPKHGNFLVFDWPAAGGIVFAKKVRGSEPTRFWTKALENWGRIVAQVMNGG